ncbi:MAG: hypothetical protein PHY71_02165 [Bacteroidaceae bacterium]|nr:hypothetical protein [Bacteroidaceae bacterium]
MKQEISGLQVSCERISRCTYIPMPTSIALLKVYRLFCKAKNKHNMIIKIEADDYNLSQITNFK